MAILSVSRRTDIPAFYSEWFFNRLTAGEICVRNPFNTNQVTQYLFKPEDIDCIVFWTKNPIPMMNNNHLERLMGIPHYFQFTLNAYDNDLETFVPSKMKLVEAFKTLSQNSSVVWRYDPIMFTKKYDLMWHMKAFQYLCEQLAGHTDRCIISFVDLYESVKSTLYTADIIPKQETEENILRLCEFISKTAAKNGMKVYSCAEKLQLDNFGIGHSSCIDKGLVEKAAGYPINVRKNSGQRKECGCIESVDVGKYTTCKNGCKYCYACKSSGEYNRNISIYNENSPFLCDVFFPKDEVIVKKLKSFKNGEAYNQLSLF